MKLTVLAENTACREDMIAQHGLSLYLETADQRILFDMGQDTAFIRNAQTLGIDLSKVDLAVISHGHYDHGGGLAEFLKINPTAPVYIHPQAFGAYYNGTEKYIGLDVALKDHPRLVFTGAVTELSDGLRLMDCNDLGWAFDSWGLNRKTGDQFTPDPFLHEQYLQITEGKKRYLISGCSHKGIENIVSCFHPDVLVGGFHLSKQEDEQVLLRIGKTLLSGQTVYYTGHCTGSRQGLFLKQQMGERLRILSTGMTMEL